MGVFFWWLGVVLSVLNSLFAGFYRAWVYLGLMVVSLVGFMWFGVVAGWVLFVLASIVGGVVNMKQLEDGLERLYDL